MTSVAYDKRGGYSQHLQGNSAMSNKKYHWQGQARLSELIADPSATKRVKLQSPACQTLQLGATKGEPRLLIASDVLQARAAQEP